MRLNTNARQAFWLMLALIGLLGTWAQILD